MDDAWDTENFDPPNLKPIASGDKWEGEDEDDDVKDNWEDEEEEKKDEEKQEEVKAFQVKKKKKISEVIEEKERKEKEAARKLAAKEAAKEAMKNLTPEEKLAEKLRQQRLQEEADLEVTKETFGVVESLESIDAMDPNTMEDFNNLQDALIKKLQPLSASKHFPLFIQNLTRSICVILSTPDLKKVKATIDTVVVEKMKAEKAEKTKKNKSKGKAKLLVEGENEYSAYGTGDYDDFDDFI